MGPRTTTILVSMVVGVVAIILCCCIVLFLDRYRSAMVQSARTGSAQTVSQVSSTVGNYLRDMDQAMDLVVRGPIRDASLFKAPHPSFLCSALRRIALGDSPQYFLKQ